MVKLGQKGQRLVNSKNSAAELHSSVVSLRLNKATCMGR